MRWGPVGVWVVVVAVLVGVLAARVLGTSVGLCSDGPQGGQCVQQTTWNPVAGLVVGALAGGLVWAFASSRSASRRRWR